MITFVSLGFFWVSHHIMYHAIRRADRTLLWLNILFFMFVSLLPFLTTLLNAFLQAFMVPFFRRVLVGNQLESIKCQTLPLLGMNFSATPLLHQRWPVGFGPSLKT